MLAAKKVNTSLPGQEAVELVEPMFSKSQLVRCGRYQDRKDLVDALLDDGKKYTMEQVDKMIGEFMKGRVK